MYKNQPVRYFHWNLGTATTPSVPYPNKTITSASALVSWVYSVRPSVQKATLAAWIGAIGRKSLHLSARLLAGSGRSVVLFTRRRSDEHNPTEAAALREAAMRYHSCGGDRAKRGEEDLATAMRALRQSSDMELEALARSCLEDQVWFVRHFCANGSGKETCLCRAARGDNRTLGGFSSLGSFLEPSPERSRRNSASAFLLRRDRKKISAGGPSADVNVHNLAVRRKRVDCASAAADPRTCTVLSYQGLAAVLATASEEVESEDNLDGLGCSDNRTLNFYLADSGTQGALARQLGLSEGVEEAAVIIDLPAETVYVMEEEEQEGSAAITFGKLSRFIVQFHREPSSLHRLKLTSPEVENKATDKDAESWIRPLSSADFDSSVLNATSGVLLLYTSRSCGACPSFAHAFHGARRLLAPHVDFYSVDAGANDLPWFLSALTVPTILFFPPGDRADKAESRAFPSSKALNVTNLLSFVVANLPLEER